MTTTIDPRDTIHAEATGETSPLKRALRRVLEEPSSDLYRLDYADELESVGEREHGEFIRVQCQIYMTSTLGVPLACGHWADGLKANGAECDCEDHVAVRQAWNRENDLFTASNARKWGLGGKWRHMRYPRTAEDGTSPAATFTRGFVSRIECTLAAFMGGMGAMADPPGLVDTLFGCQPVESVTITDREPHEITDNIYFWSLGEVEQSRSHGLGYSFIPKELWILLTDMSSSVADYPTRESALLALSRACVALGRSRAGLPPI